VAADRGVGADLEVGLAEFVLDLFVALLDPVPQAVEPYHFGEIGGRVAAVCRAGPEGVLVLPGPWPRLRAITNGRRASDSSARKVLWSP